MDQISPKLQFVGWRRWLRLAFVIVFTAWGVIGAPDPPAASADSPDGIWVAVSMDSAGGGEAHHLAHADCSARTHCASPAVLTAVLSIAAPCEPDWTRSVQTILGARSAAPEIPPPNRLAA